MTNFLTSQFAILNKTKSPLVIKNLRIPELKKNQLLVEIKYSYVCGSQLNEIFGLKGKDKHLPHTLGHEGSGIIRSIGKNIKDIKKPESQQTQALLISISLQVNDLHESV